MMVSCREVIRDIVRVRPKHMTYGDCRVIVAHNGTHEPSEPAWKAISHKRSGRYKFIKNIMEINPY